MRQTHIPEDKSGHTEAGQVGDESETHIDTPSRTQVRHTQAECKSNLVTCTLVHVHTCTPTPTHTKKDNTSPYYPRSLDVTGWLWTVVMFFTHACTYTHSPRHMCLHTCTHECTHTLTHTHRPSSIGALLPKAMRHDKLAVGHGYIFHMHAHTTHIHMHMCSHTHTCKHIHSHESHACMHTYTCMCARTHTHTHTHTKQNHTHIHTHTKTTHIHTQNTHTQLYGVPVTRGHEA